MIAFPSSTNVHRKLPKEAFYRNLSLSPKLKEKFVSDIEQIYMENSLSAKSLNLNENSEIKEILLLAIILKKQEFDAKIIEEIAKQNPHKLVFLLCFADKRQLAIYHGKLYRSEWENEEEIRLEIAGASVDAIWEHFIEQVALYEEKAESTKGLSINERLKLEEQIAKLQKLIDKTEAAAWKEQQPKKRFELYSQVQTYKQKLEELKHGQA